MNLLKKSQGVNFLCRKNFVLELADFSELQNPGSAVLFHSVGMFPAS